MKNGLGRRLTGAALGVTILLCGCQASPVTEPVDPGYVAEVEAWRNDREAGLRRTDGWLTLVGLFWLEDGESSFGADPSNDVIFPPGSGDFLGVFRLSDGQVTVEADAASGIRHGDEQVERITMRPDTSGEPTVLELGSLTFFVIERAGRLGIRVKDSESPALREFSGMEYFPIDPSWRLEARFTTSEEPRTMMVPNVVGTAFEESVPGVVSFEHRGRHYELTPTGEAGKPLFFVFGDATNGGETYGGGRFLYAVWPSDDGVVVLDFNLAYNPPCVFSPFATCPLPAALNKLPIAVEAGELSYGSEH